MSEPLRESLFPCAVSPSRAMADEIVARLVSAGIDAVISEAGSRFHGLGAGACEITVPATQAARARAILSA
jgi:hypothetical protein